jgi:hypothetical protein
MIYLGRHIYSMKIKFRVLDKLKVFKSLSINKTRKKIKEIKCDGVGI